jgi:putative colanic acid biosynthesis glycosyltransferase
VKVLQINSVCGIGSTGRIVTDIHAILNEEGHESYIAYGRGDSKNCDSTIKVGNKYTIYSHVLKTRIFDKHGFGSKRATKEFIKKIRELDPDVIHLHNIHGYYINVEVLFQYLKEANKPVVWTLHDCWPFTGHCAYFEYSGCNCWRLDGDHKCIQKNSYPSSFLFNNSKENFERKKMAFTGVKNLTIVTPSRWLANLVKKSFLNEYSIKVINNGIDLKVIRPSKAYFRQNQKLENKYIILGVASVWDKRKGLQYFKELSNLLTNDEVIVLVGLSEKQQKKLPANIIGITKTNNLTELVEIYSSADVFVNPTLEDNFPTTNLEALACGTPVITFNTGGSVECIDSSCGHIVKKGDLNELIEVIRLVKLKGKQYYQNNCLKRANYFFNKDDKFKEYINLYKKVVGKK